MAGKQTLPHGRSLIGLAREPAMESGDAGSPKLSIIIAAHDPGPVIADCLAVLEAQNERHTAEIIVADSSSDGTADLIRERFPKVCLLHYADPISVPHLRGVAIAAARGEVIAILDPYCIVQDGWLTELLVLQARRPELVVGGAVELECPNDQNLVRWATYFCEYAAFMPPLREGPCGELTGNNIAYRRRALENGEALARLGFWKAFVNWRLQAAGHQLWSAPTLVVKLRKPIPFTKFLRSRYHHGRCHGGMRISEAPQYQRWWRVLSVSLVPYLLLGRQLQSFWPKRRHRLKFVMTIPLLLLFHYGWAWGELWGYLRGPGRSCAQILH